MGTFQALRHPNYRLYFAGQLVSLTGWWMQSAALVWLAHRWTGTTSWPAWIVAAQVLPMLVLSVPAGALADRMPRRPLIAASQVACIVVSLLLAAQALAGITNPWLLLGQAILAGVANAFDTSARLAFIIDLVGRADLPNAVALNSLTFNLARLAGPALAGAALATLGAASCFLANAVSTVAVLVALAAMQLPTPVVSRTRGAGTGALVLLARKPELILILVLAGCVSFFGWPLLSLLPELSGRLGLKEQGYGLLVGAVGGGALVGALAVATLAGRLRHPILGAGIVLAAAALWIMPHASGLWEAAACCALSGFGLILFFSTGQAIMQMGADETNRGRIMGVWLSVLAGAHPLGHLTAGTLADLLGVDWVLPRLGVGMLATASLVGLAALMARPAPAAAGSPP